MGKLYEKSETGCCLRFNPKPWDGKTVVWTDKLFLKDHVFSIFHIPITMNKVMVKNMTKIMAAKAQPAQPLMLSDECSLWGSDIYIAVAKNVPDAEMVKTSGTFLMKVFEGNYSEAGKWAKEMEAFVKSKKKVIKKLYFWYTTCPKCAKFYGKNYTVLVAQV